MSQMVEQVARLIGNRLACGGDVFLPNVGSLFVVHHGAEQLSRRWIQPPYRRVDFTSQERGESLPDMIARAASCDADTARTVYDRWLEQTRKETVLTIAGVGTLTYKNFAPVSEFERRLNPQGRAPDAIASVREFRLGFGARNDGNCRCGTCGRLLSDAGAVFPNAAACQSAGCCRPRRVGDFGCRRSIRCGFDRDCSQAADSAGSADRIYTSDSRPLCGDGSVQHA